MSMEGGGASSALQSLLGSGSNSGGGGTDPSLTLGSDVGAKMVNEGAGMCSIEGKVLMSNPQGGVFGQPNTYGLASSLIDMCAKIAQFDLKAICDEIANMCKADPSEVTGGAQFVDAGGSASHAEVASAGGAAVESIDVSHFANMNLAGIETSGPIKPNVAAAESGSGIAV